MREITLCEHKTSEPLLLSLQERDALAELVPSLVIQPCAGTTDHYLITPGHMVGAVTLENLSLVIQPKIPIDRVLFLISYALRTAEWRSPDFSFASSDSLVEAVALSFAAHLQRAFRSGLLQGYRNEEDALTTVRGRIRFAEQLKRRFGAAPPIEVAYDDFTEDVRENRILKAALMKLRRMRIRSREVQTKLSRFEQLLSPVSVEHFDRGNLPTIHYSRLNEHYRPAVELAELILRVQSLELRHGRFYGSAFVVDMNRVFEEFVYLALRDALKLSEKQFRRQAKGHSIYLDDSRRVVLEPDLTWWDHEQCVFVGDVKYKRINVPGIKHPDLYQLLAYTVATDLPNGMLIYAAGEGVPAEHDVVFVNKRLEVVSIDLEGVPSRILEQMRGLAERVRAQRSDRIGGDYAHSLSPITA